MDAKDAAKLVTDLCSLISDAMDFAEARLDIGEDPLQPIKERIEAAPGSRSGTSPNPSDFGQSRTKSATKRPCI